MKKKLRMLLILSVMMTLLVGCGSKEKNKTNEAGNSDAAVDVDVNAVADAIKNGGDFKDNLAVIDSTIGLTRVLNIADTSIIEESAFYTNSSSSAEEIIVIKTKSTDDVKTVTDAFDVRINSQKEACKDYLPDEMPKLENALKYTNGNYAILVISNDSAKAKDIINGYFK